MKQANPFRLTPDGLWIVVRGIEKRPPPRRTPAMETARAETIAVRMDVAWEAHPSSGFIGTHGTPLGGADGDRGSGGGTEPCNGGRGMECTGFVSMVPHHRHHPNRLVRNWNPQKLKPSWGDGIILACWGMS